MMDEPRLIEGGLVTDERGQVSFVNDFGFEGVKRCYLVKNHTAGFVGAWQAHRLEGKFVMAVEGSVLFGAVAVDDWQTPSKTARVHQFRLSANEPRVLVVPPGHANGFMSLTQDAKLVFYSTSTLAESKGDDFRFPPRYWDIWDVKE